MAAVVAEEAIYDLEAPIRRVTGFDVPWPQFAVERHGLVDADRVTMELELLLDD